MAHYSLVTTWRLQAPVERVWDAILHSEQWPLWWRYVQRVEELRPGDCAGLNSVRRYTWGTSLPYSLQFVLRATHIEPCIRLEAEVSGDLEGRGDCRLLAGGAATTVQYEWNVRTCIPWMNRLAPVARPVFIWNHRRVMEVGGQGLARWLAAPGLTGADGG